MTAVVLTPGANTGIPDCGRILVAVGWDPKSQPGMEVDASAFMVGADGKVPNDEHFVFYSSQASPDDSVRFIPSLADQGDVQAFEIAPAKVGSTVESVDVCVTIHEGQSRGQSFGGLRGVFARLVDLSSGQEIARFDLQPSGMNETAITLVKVYRRNGQWKFRAVGQGFAGGLALLARQYGVDVTDEAPPPVQEKSAAAPPPPQAPPPAPATKPVSLTKVALEKRGQSVSLEKKRDEGFGEVVVNLNWNQRPEKKGGFLGGLLGGSKGIDLDLGCLWELEDGYKGVIQALGELWGEYRSEPFIRHAGDDRTGAMSQGENIRINGDQITKIKRILVFAFIYDGVPNWAAADGVATVKVPGQHDIEVRLDNPASGQGTCAIAMIENDKGKLKVTKEERYFRGHLDMDKAYRWGLRWGGARSKY
jgi:tellurite resistance protein TerA